MAVAAPTPRERTEQKARTKGRQTAPPGSDWMRTHGKYIAVGFVFALIATIYMARSGDEPAPAHRDAAATSADENGTDGQAALGEALHRFVVGGFEEWIHAVTSPCGVQDEV